MPSVYDWSLTAASNGNADSDINFSEGQAPSTVNNSARMVMQRVRELVSDLGGSIDAGGSANAITVTAKSSFAALADGLIVCFRATAANTGATTLAVNGLTSKPIVKMTTSGESTLSGGEIQSGGIYVAHYTEDLNTSLGAWLLLNPAAGITLTQLAALIVTASAKATPIDADTFPLIDSADSSTLKEVTLANLKAAIFPTTTRGDIMFRGASVVERLAKGSSGQYLTQGSDDPQWATLTDAISGMILSPSNGDYRLVVKIPFAGTITETATRSASGTCTATFKVNTTSLGGTANSVSSTEQARTHSSSNTFVADDDIVVTISSNSSCANMSFTIKFTRS